MSCFISSYRLLLCEKETATYAENLETVQKITNTSIMLSYAMKLFPEQRWVEAINMSATR